MRRTVRKYNPPSWARFENFLPGTAEAERYRSCTCVRVTRKTLSMILNRRSGISPEMAVRLSIAFSTTAGWWLSQQTQYDLWMLNSAGNNFESGSSRLS
jgi:addiction module HigA family antidote